MRYQKLIDNLKEKKSLSGFILKVIFYDMPKLLNLYYACGGWSKITNNDGHKQKTKTYILLCSSI